MGRKQSVWGIGFVWTLGMTGCGDSTDVLESGAPACVVREPSPPGLALLWEHVAPVEGEGAGAVAVDPCTGDVAMLSSSAVLLTVLSPEGEERWSKTREGDHLVYSASGALTFGPNSSVWIGHGLSSGSDLASTVATFSYDGKLDWTWTEPGSRAPADLVSDGTGRVWVAMWSLSEDYGTDYPLWFGADGSVETRPSTSTWGFARGTRLVDSTIVFTSPNGWQHWDADGSLLESAEHDASPSGNSLHWDKNAAALPTSADTVFTSETFGSGEARYARVAELDRHDGAILWEHRLEHPWYTMGRRSLHVAADGTRYAILVGAGQPDPEQAGSYLLAFGANGELLWQ